MKESLLSYLICPNCHSEFKLSITKMENAEIMEGSLLCFGCRSEYSIIKGIPRMLDRWQDSVSERTARNFGYSWLNVWKLGSADELEFKSYLAGLIEKEYFKDKLILDAGCGNGRFTYFSGSYANRDVIGFDLSNSVEAAFWNTKHLKNVHIVQADIYKLPFKKKFSFIYSIGVLHHLPRPEEGFGRLVDVLHNNGEILAWVYGKEGNGLYLTLFEPFRMFTSRLPLSINKKLALVFAAAIWSIIQLIYVPLSNIGLAENLPLGKYLLSFYRLGFRQFRGTVFDKMIPPISNYYAKQEFIKWFQNGGLQNIRILERNNNSWRGLGTFG